MSLQDKALIGAHLFLRGLPDDHLAQLAKFSRHVTVPAGQRLFEEGATAGKFWLIDAGQVAIDTVVPGRGRLTIETIGRGDVTGVSWLLPPYQWRFGAVTRQRMQAFEFDARAVRAICDEDPAVGYQLSRRISGILARRLEATHARLRDSYANSDTAS
jgi:CRP/FNR family cyclic AMP-dependent transcriptional regulator